MSTSSRGRNPSVTAATVLREVPSGKSVTRADVARAPHADTPVMTRRRRLANPGISRTVTIPSSISARRNPSPALASLHSRTRSSNATSGTLTRSTARALVETLIAMRVPKKSIPRVGAPIATTRRQTRGSFGSSLGAVRLARARSLRLSSGVSSARRRRRRAARRAG